MFKDIWMELKAIFKGFFGNVEPGDRCWVKARHNGKLVGKHFTGQWREDFATVLETAGDKIIVEMYKTKAREERPKSDILSVE